MESLLCTVPETAALLRVHPDTIRRAINTNLIPVKRLRGNVRISREWVTQFCNETAPILLTRRQVSAKLGVSRYVVGTLLRKGLLSVVKVGKMQRIPAAAVNEYVKRNAFALLRSSSEPRQREASEASRPVDAVPVPVAVRHLGFGSVRGV